MPAGRGERWSAAPRDPPGEGEIIKIKSQPPNPPGSERGFGGVSAHRGSAGAAEKTPQPRDGNALPGLRAQRGEGICGEFRGFFGLVSTFHIYFAAFPMGSARAGNPPGAERGSGRSGRRGLLLPSPWKSAPGIGGALPGSATLGDNQSVSVKAAHGPGGCSGRIPSSVLQQLWMR